MATKTPHPRAKAGNTATPRRKHLSVREVAAEWNFSEHTVRGLIASGELCAYKIGRSIRIDPDDADKARRRITAGGDNGAHP